jgi:hypothetical protein
MPLPIGCNVGRSHTGNSRRKTAGAWVETRKTACQAAAAKRQSVSMVLVRENPMQRRGEADRQAAQNHLAEAGRDGAAGPRKGAPAENRDAT